MKKQKLTIFAAVGLLAIVVAASICLLASKKNYDDPKIYTEEKFGELAQSAYRNPLRGGRPAWVPEDGRKKIKFTVTEVNTENTLFGEGVKFKGEVRLSENFYSTLNLYEVLGLPARDVNQYLETALQAPVLLVKEWKAGDTLSVEGEYLRGKNADGEWMTDSPNISPAVYLTSKAELKPEKNKILKEGSAEFKQYIEKLKADYENAKKREAEEKAQREKRAEELKAGIASAETKINAMKEELTPLSAELQKLRLEMKGIANQYNSNVRAQERLNNQISRESGKLRTAKPQARIVVQARLKQLQQELQTRQAEGARLKEKGKALEEPIATQKQLIEKKNDEINAELATLRKLQEELRQLQLNKF